MTTTTEDRSDSSEKFGECVKKIVPLLVPEEDVAGMQERRKASGS
jgi:hypothetical protein